MKPYKGLITDVQQPVELATHYWQYGTVVNDEKIIDPLLHYGCFVLGFDRTDIVDHVCQNIKRKPEIAESMVHNEQLRLNDVTFELTERLHNITGYKSIFALSGSDANEGAVKLASAYHKHKGNKRNQIVTFENSYHGSTLLNYSMGDSLFEDPFYTLPPYSAVKRLKRDFAISDCEWDDVMCIMVETCSYGGGLLKPNTEEFWNKITQIQKKHDVIVIVDDIFIGGGKTGTFVGWKNLPISPDIFTMGKAITAGFFPLSITLYNQKVSDVLPNNFNWGHGFTYNFSLAGILSTLKYLDILQQEQLLSKHTEICVTAKNIFNQAGYDVVGQFGTMFQINRGTQGHFFVLPINATYEYFEILRKQIQ